MKVVNVDEVLKVLYKYGKYIFGADVEKYTSMVDEIANLEAVKQEPMMSESKKLIDELSKMPPMVIATAYHHAINYTLYGEDVTEKWLTAVQQTSALEKAYYKGYYDALERQSERRDTESIPYIMHKEMDIPISECQKAYEVAIDYLREQGKVKG